MTLDEKREYIKQAGWKFTRLTSRGHKWKNAAWPASEIRDMSTSDAYTAQRSLDRFGPIPRNTDLLKPSPEAQ